VRKVVVAGAAVCAAGFLLMWSGVEWTGLAGAQSSERDGPGEILGNGSQAVSKWTRTGAGNRAEEIPGLLAAIGKASGADNERERLDALNGELATLVALDAKAAAELLKKMEPGPFREDYLLRLGQFWAARDPEGALEWASGLTDEGERGGAVQAVCIEMGQTNPEGAIQALEKFGKGEEQSGVDALAQR